jgi:hypothetical protein
VTDLNDVEMAAGRRRQPRQRLQRTPERAGTLS